MKGRLGSFIFTALGLIFSVLPPALATLAYFPVWIERGGAAVLSGFTLILLILAAVPLISFIKKIFASPAAYLMWLIIFVIFFMLSKIANEMTVISFVGFLGNAVGALMFKLAGGGGGE